MTKLVTLPLIENACILCGDRNWTDPRPIDALLATMRVDSAFIITGGAPGADSLAADGARTLGFRNAIMHAPWGVNGKRAGPMRNQWMLDLLVAVAMTHKLDETMLHVHAFHDHIASSKGTADMLSRTRAAGIRYTIHSSPP